MDYLDAEKVVRSDAIEALHSFDYLNEMPGYIRQPPSVRHTARKSYAFENIIVCAGGRRDSTSASLMDNAEYFNPRTSKWKCLARLPDSAAKGGLAIINNVLFLCGGIIGQQDTDVTIATDLAFCYQPTSDIWIELPKMPTARYRASACVGSDGWIYVIGRCAGSPVTALSCVEAFHPRTKRWAKKCAVSRPAYSSKACCYGDKIYVLGGYSRITQKVMEVYDVFANTWVTMESQMATPRWGMCCAADIPKDSGEQL
ncbi:kelch-like protein 36 [Paramacrobiotus metropolitanus]|uniref:kelch-like protein 36 n=1 Tax=Paramacrobiotus metropolitanus TaxID=2943436 RepID=UPI0024459962|nr:kelch-like protein 36 [Paramacrobiotus metropolitanus]